MAGLGFVATLSGVSSHYLQGISDFEFFQTSDGVVLYSAGLALNGLSVFSLSQGQSAVFLEETALAPRSTLAPLDLSLVNFGSASSLWIEPWTVSGQTSFAPNAQGLLGPAVHTSGAPALGPGLVHSVSIDAPGPNSWVFGGIWGQSGIAKLTLDSSGNLLDTTSIQGAESEDVQALSQAVIAGTTFLFSASLASPAVTTWQVGSDGQLTQTASLGATDGLGISVPSAMEVVEIAGETFVILASTGSSSLSVMQVGADGSLTLVDHIVDDLGTFFAHSTTLSVVSSGGHVFVLAGGSDGGISLFELLPGGRLIHRESVADTGDTTLDHVSALDAIVVNGEIQVFAASDTETGITQFTLTRDAPGVILTDIVGTGSGTALADILQAGGAGAHLVGGAGQDVLMDGGGSDTLSGGAGADLFVLTPDDTTDVITDFKLGIDKIDLSFYRMLYDLNQLNATPTSNGIILSFQGETLEIITADMSSLQLSDFTNADLFSTQHAMPMVAIHGGLRLTGTSAHETMAGGAGADVIEGRGGNDTLNGRAGNDQISGGAGKDILKGGLGGDALSGNAGADKLLGGGGNDTLSGGGGSDTLKGGAGADQLNGNGGVDKLLGGAGADRMAGGGGKDTLSGGAGADNLKGGGGADILKGGNGADKLIGGSGNDTLNGNAGKDKLFGGTGGDRLDGGAGNDTMLGGAGSDTFVFSSGKDKIKDFSLAEDHLVLQSSLWPGTLTVAEVFDAYAVVTGSKVHFDFGSGNHLWLVGVTDLAGLAALTDIA